MVKSKTRDCELHVVKSDNGFIPVQYIPISSSRSYNFYKYLLKMFGERKQYINSTYHTIEIFVADGESISAKISSANTRILKKQKDDTIIVPEH